jgi:uncharacterized protein YegP (UPF0339 family)
MAGHFEVIDAPGGGFRVRMLDAEGMLMTLSVTNPTKEAAKQGIALTREITGTGLVLDRSRPARAAQA